MARLGIVAKLLKERFEKRRREADNVSQADRFGDPLQKLIYGLLTDFGLDYPIDFVVKPPDIADVSRQGTFVLAPGTTKTLTFKARKRGFLVIEQLEFIAEEPISNSNIRILYDFGTTRRSFNYQSDKTVSEPGMWKMNSQVLDHGAVLTVSIVNADLFAQAIVSVAADMWMI